MSSKLPLLYLVIGDPFLTEEKFKEIETSVHSDYPEINLETFRLSDTSLDPILEKARSLPFLADAQIFRIREADSLKEKKFEMLDAYFQHSYEKTYFVFECESLEKVHLLREIAGKYGQIHTLDPTQKKTQAGKLIKAKLQAYGKTITPQALERLEVQMGDAPVFLHSVIDQMAHYAGKQKQIDETIVEKFEERWQEMDVFQLANAISAKKLGAALGILRQMGAEKESEIIGLIGFFHWQFRRLWQVALKLERGQSQDAVLKECKVYPKQAPYFLRQLKSFPRSKLEQILEALFQLDWKIKTGQISAGYGVEAWLIETTS